MLAHVRGLFIRWRGERAEFELMAGVGKMK